MVKVEKIDYYEKIIQGIERQLKVFVHESCSIIYTYLNIFGRMTYKDLLDKTELGRGTIFRSLSLLQEANLVAKGTDPDIKDKRKKSYYYAKENDLLVNMTKEFCEYLDQTNREEIFKIWQNHELTIPNLTMKTVTRIRRQKQFESITKGLASSEEDDSLKLMLSYSEIASIADRNKLLEKIMTCVNEFETQMQQETRNYKEPMVKPTALQIVFVPID
ncbi:MAG: hypothetical protein ACXAC7_08785 [Candidatus Hodarchaeales archaeon]|jgi:predicted transcriptional regulator